MLNLVMFPLLMIVTCLSPLKGLATNVAGKVCPYNVAPKDVVRNGRK